MSDPAIKAALREAGEAARLSLGADGGCLPIACANCTLPPCACADAAAAAAVAAFLRALPDWCLFQEFGRPPVPGTTGSGHITDLAAAVERAAQEETR
jgi:hypothetical protein